MMHPGPEGGMHHLTENGAQYTILFPILFSGSGFT